MQDAIGKPGRKHPADLCTLHFAFCTEHFDLYPEVHTMTVRILSAALVCFVIGARGSAQDSLPKAVIDGTGPGWKELSEKDFVNVNGDKDTWTWKEGLAHCTGQPVGVIRSQKQYKNFELVVQWQHL